MLQSALDSPSGVLESPLLAAVAGLSHGFTTRASPGTEAPIAAGWVEGRIVQVHGSRAVRSEEPSATIPEADALVSARRGDLVLVRTADCQAVLAAALDEGRAVAVAAIHAGWRGAVAGVVENALVLLHAAAPRATRVVAALGPAIGPCCFEVGEEVAARFAERSADLVARGEGRPHADLPGLVLSILASRGVEVEQVRPPCTRCRPDLFHSYRADGADAGRMTAFAGLRAGS